MEFGAELIDRLDAAGCDSRTIFRTGVLQYDCILTRLRWQQAIRYPSTSFGLSQQRIAVAVIFSLI